MKQVCHLKKKKCEFAYFHVHGPRAERKPLRQSQCHLKNLKKMKKKSLTSRSMPYYCSFCGKMCTTAPGLEQHIARTPDCKKASGEKFNEYAKSIWDDVPANPNDAEQPPLENLPDLPDLPDIHLEEDLQLAEDTLYDDEINLPQPPPPPPHVEPEPNPQPATEVPNNEDSGRYIENFLEEYLADATWGRCKPLFESIEEEQKRAGRSCWAPFEDEDEWQLAEWLIRNIGQKQTDTFLKLPIVSFFLSLFQYI
jgi:hypothetical protein